MANQPNAVALKRMLGQTIVLSGKFDFGERERLQSQAEAQQGIVKEELDSSVNYLVLADISAGKTIQKKVASLNAKGASIQVIDASAFKPMVEPTEAEVLELIRGGSANAAILAKAVNHPTRRYYSGPQPAAFTFTGEQFEQLDLSGFNFEQIAFSHCSFKGSNLSSSRFQSATNCDFSKVIAPGAFLGQIEQSRFIEANLSKAEFRSHFDGCDFSAANLQSATLSEQFWASRAVKRPASPGVVFSRANLRGAHLDQLHMKAPDFDQAHLSKSKFTACELTAATFRGCDCQEANLIGAVLENSDFSNARLNHANLCEAKLSHARFDGADLADCNLRGAALDGVDLAKAKNHHPATSTGGAAGPALTELDQIADNARLIKISFKVRAGADDEGDEVSIDSRYLRYGSGLRLPPSLAAGRMQRGAKSSFADAMLQLANILGSRKVRFETVDVQSSKTSKSAKELRELVMNSIAEAFNQPIPPADELAAAIKVVRAEAKDQSAADRARREQAKLLADKQKQTEKKQIAKKIAKEVGKVTDIATFLKALELRADKSKIDKATKMLKAERFKLFNDITDTHLAGVIKSQTDPDLVYACRIESDGQYACCTQNLNICGGLRGSICKHLLVLIIGLVKAGELDPSAIDAWVAKTHDTKPELNKETMGEIFIKYKGAEAGEVDWRPTETLPEDYYAL